MRKRRREDLCHWIRTCRSGFDIKILETDLREFSERLEVYVDWESGDEEDLT